MVLERARLQNINLNRCPTCNQPRTEVAPGIWIWAESTYRLDGQDHDCDCEWQDELRRHYMLANIPMGYWSLSVDEWYGDQDALYFTLDYLEKWEQHKRFGMGVEFYSPRLGVGKTMLSLIIAKELIRHKEHVYYVPFGHAVSALIRDPEETEILRTTPVLIIDEVKAGYTEAQQSLFADQFEDLIRFRTSGAAVTIVSTNLTPEAMEQQFGRCYSLLSAKQYRYHVQGTDVRKDGTVMMRQEELNANNEVLPIQ